MYLPAAAVLPIPYLVIARIPFLAVAASRKYSRVLVLYLRPSCVHSSATYHTLFDINFQHPTTNMEAFEDENPFESEPERLQSDSSSSRANISALSSPVPQEARVSSPPTSPRRQNAFPSPGSHRQPQAFKSDFCCARDRWLHSGEDVEIMVRTRPVCERWMACSNTGQSLLCG